MNQFIKYVGLDTHKEISFNSSGTHKKYRLIFGT